MNPFKRVSPYILVLPYLGICMLFSGCVKGGGGAMKFSAGQLTSVPQSEPHGTLTVIRSGILEIDKRIANMREFSKNPEIDKYLSDFGGLPEEFRGQDT